MCETTTHDRVALPLSFRADAGRSDFRVVARFTGALPQRPTHHPRPRSVGLRQEVYRHLRRLRAPAHRAWAQHARSTLRVRGRARGATPRSADLVQL